MTQELYETFFIDKNANAIGSRFSEKQLSLALNHNEKLIKEAKEILFRPCPPMFEGEKGNYYHLKRRYDILQDWITVLKLWKKRRNLLPRYLGAFVRCTIRMFRTYKYYQNGDKTGLYKVQNKAV